jgi:hypothetical protein
LAPEMLDAAEKPEVLRPVVKIDTYKYYTDI